MTLAQVNLRYPRKQSTTAHLSPSTALNGGSSPPPLLSSYMAEKAFKSPRTVWLNDLRAILNLEIDAEQKWAKKLSEAMFPADAWLTLIKRC